MAWTRYLHVNTHQHYYGNHLLDVGTISVYIITLYRGTKYSLYTSGWWLDSWYLWFY